METRDDVGDGEEWSEQPHPDDQPSFDAVTLIPPQTLADDLDLPDWVSSLTLTCSPPPPSRLVSLLQPPLATCFCRR